MLMENLIYYFVAGCIFFALACARYLLMTGAYYLVVCKWFDRYLYRFKINHEKATPEIMTHEIKWALLNNVNFGIIGIFTLWLYNQGYLRVYLDLDKYGVIYAIAIVPILLVLLDTYFYWTHYFMHRGPKRIKSSHHVHHYVRNVSPWSAFSVHPTEGFVEILSRPLILAIVPLHPYSIVGFLIVTFALNIIGHSGYEFFPANYSKSLFSKFNSCATFHYMHHNEGNSNFSLFFNFWDRIMGTLNPNYDAFYEKVKRNQEIKTHDSVA